MRLLRPAAVEVHGLEVHPAGRGAALHGLDLSVPVGARLLLVARPEASASLLLRVLAGLVRPAGGRIALAGLTREGAGSEGLARRIGYVGPEPAIYGWLSPNEALELCARLAGMDRAEARLRIEPALDRFGLREAASMPIRRAGPMVAQKTALAAALLAEPEVLLLDEALRSVDPEERARLLNLKPRRLTVLLASRYPASEAGLVNQVALIRDGRLAVHASLDELDKAGLELSGRGIEALADRRGAGARPFGAAPPIAAGRS